MRYSNTGKNKKNGVVYTPTEMADYVAFEMLKYKRNGFERSIDILDPAVGKGELLISMINAVKKNGLPIKAVGYETDEVVATKTQELLQDMYPEASIEIRTGDFLEAVENNSAGKYDLVIANPPYIRTQIMGREKAQEIAERLNLAGRVDIYYAFLVYTKNVLKKDGISGYITSNKFMTIKAGNSVRNYISPFIEKFYDVKFNNKLYSGKRRYQTQYVEQFPIPYYNSELAQKAISLVKKILAEGAESASNGDKKELDLLVEQMFS